MSSICWIGPMDGPASLPEPSLALAEPNGLLAAGGSLEPEWLLRAYERGVFPWYEEGQPILWWCPDPRAVLRPQGLKVSRSLRRRVRRCDFRITADTAFERVIDACAAPRRYTDSTWITAEMRSAYTQLHRLGWAHSFEAWIDDRLVGGLYGVAIGRVFFGESMFAAVTDASKVAFVKAVRFMHDRGIELIDCQLPSEHLTRLGATSMRRTQFLEKLAGLCATRGAPGAWSGSFDDLEH